MSWRRTVGWGGGVVLVGVVGYLLLAPVSIEPVAWDPPPPAPEGAYPPNDRLTSAERLLIGYGVGPEDVALAPDGRLYTGYANGDIVAFTIDGTNPAVVVNTGGRPLGMEFDRAGHLLVADARKGLLRVDVEGEATVEVLADACDGEPIDFADDLDIAADGTVWFTDAADGFDVGQSEMAAIEGRATGRLMQYDPKTGVATTRLGELRFANGVEVGPDDAFVLVNETFAYRVTRLWLAGERAGQTDALIESLPGMPDNVDLDAEGNAWVALVLPRSTLLDGLGPYPFVRKMLGRVPHALLPIPPEWGWVLAVSPEGEVLANLQDRTGNIARVTSATPAGDYVYFGSLERDALARMPRAAALAP